MSPLSSLALSEKVLKRLHGRDLTGRLCHSDLWKLVGAGGYSTVFRGYLKGPDEIVAIKVLRFTCNEERMKQLFEQEVYVWAKFQHKNIARLLGFAFNSDNEPLLISPWMENGSAWDFVTRPENKSLDVYPLVLGIARGLHYLHAEMDSIHSDLKAANVLVSSLDPLDAVIADFGTSRVFNASLTIGRPTPEIKGTARWIAIELFRNAVRNPVRKTDPERLAYSTASDVWAFGMTVYELLVRQSPYHPYPIDAQVVIAIMEGKLPEFGTGFDGPNVQVLKNICHQCWNFYPGERITMSDVLMMLDGRTLGHDPDSTQRGELEGTTAGCLAPIVNLSHVFEHEKVSSIRFSPDGELIAIGSNHMLYVYKTNTGAKECELYHGPHLNVVREVCFSHTSSILATSASDRIIRIWDISENEVNEEVPVGGQDISSMAYEPSAGKYLVYVLADGSVYIRNNSSRKIFEIQSEAGISVAFSPDGRMIATGSTDSLVRLWNAKDRTLIRSLAGLSGSIKSVVFSPSGTRIIGCGGKMIKSWHVSEEKIHPIEFIGHQEDVLAMAVDKDADARWVLSTGGSDDGAVRIWALGNGQLVENLANLATDSSYHTGSVISIDFCKKCRLFATATRDEVRLWTYED